MGPETGVLKTRPNYSHEGVMDLILAAPGITQRELAARIGYTEGWLSQVIRSDSFQARLAERKDELIDPVIKAKLDERINSLAHRSMDILFDALDTNKSPELATKLLEITQRAKGYGATGVNITQNFVVAMPEKATDSTTWATEHRQRPVINLDAVIDA